MQTLADMLRSSIWSQGLTAPQLERVLVDTKERAVAAVGYVAHKGEPVDAWLGVVEGLVKMSAAHPR